MKLSSLLCLFGLLVFTALLEVKAAETPLEPPGVLHVAGTLPFGEHPLAQAEVILDGENPGTTYGKVDPKGTPFTTIYAFNRVNFKGGEWQFRAMGKSVAPMKKGSMIYMEFYMRTISSQTETSEGLVIAEVVSNRNQRWDGFKITVTAPQGGWVRRAIAKPITGDAEAGEGLFVLRLGAGGTSKDMHIQIADLRIVDVGPEIDAQQLPLSKFTYGGRETDAAWRAAAAERIEKHRKGDLVVAVVDAEGKPVANTPVRIAQTRHAFTFATTANPYFINLQDERGEQYRSWIVENANLVTIGVPGDLWQMRKLPKNPKWPVEWEFREENILATCAWLKEHNIAIEAAHLVWPRFSSMPKWAKDLKDKPEELRRAVTDHINEVLTTLKPYHVARWFVINENIHERELYNHISPDEIVNWFKQVREQSTAKLLYNEYTHLTFGPLEDRIAVEDDVLSLIQRKVPVDEFGIQGHFGNQLRAIDSVVEELDRIGKKLGLGIYISEFDLETQDELLQADYTRDFLTAAFASPHVTGVNAFSPFHADRKHYAPLGGMHDANWREKPNGKAWRDLIKGAWWTDVTVTTDANGIARVRGFKGDYAINAIRPAQNSSDLQPVVKATIGDAVSTVRLTLRP